MHISLEGNEYADQCSQRLTGPDHHFTADQLPPCIHPQHARRCASQCPSPDLIHRTLWLAPIASNTPLQEDNSKQPIAHEFTAKEALRTQAFWMLAIGHGLALLVVTAVNVHAITHMKEGLGYSVSEAGLVIMLMTVGQMGGVLLGASMGDRYDKRVVAALCMVSHMVGLLCLTYASHVAMMWAFALLHGVAWGLRGPYMQAIRADYFGTRWLGRIMGISTVLLAFGQMGGPLIAGMLADWQGDYRLGFSTLALLAALGSVAFWVARPPTRPKAARKAAN